MVRPHELACQHGIGHQRGIHGCDGCCYLIFGPSDDQAALMEISRLLEEAYTHYFSYEGHCKSSEGYICLEYGNLWERRENPAGEMPIKNVHIYSYVFCEQGRSEDFETLDDALETVRKWHATEMAYDYNAPEEVEHREELDKMAFEFISGLQADGRLTIIDATPRDEEDK